MKKTKKLGVILAALVMAMAVGPLADSIAAARYRDSLQKYIANARPGHAKKFVDQLVRALSWMQANALVSRAPNA